MQVGTQKDKNKDRRNEYEYFKTSKWDLLEENVSKTQHKQSGVNLPFDHEFGQNIKQFGEWSNSFYLQKREVGCLFPP